MELSIQLPYFSVLVARLEAITDQERIAGSIFHAQPCDAAGRNLMITIAKLDPLKL